MSNIKSTSALESGINNKESLELKNSSIKISDEIAEHIKEGEEDLIVIYTDGSCFGNNENKNDSTRKAGYGIFYGLNDPRNISEPLYGKYKTNNIAELKAIVEACKLHLNDRIEIITDSTYCKNIITNWMHKWKENNWTKSDRKPIQNINLIKEMYKIRENMRYSPIITWEPRNISEGNAQADKLARMGSDKCIPNKIKKPNYIK